jgi:hypothetical protein
MQRIQQRLTPALDAKISNRHCIKFGSYSFGLKETTHAELVGLAADINNDLHNTTRLVLDKCTASLRRSMREVLRSYTERIGEPLFYQPATLWFAVVDFDGKITRMMSELGHLMPHREANEIADLSLRRGLERLIACGGVDVRAEMEAERRR